MPGGRVVGVDASDSMISAARQRALARGSKAQFLLGDVRSLDLADESFDLARCVLLLLHVQDPFAAVRELVRVVRPGGRLLSIDVDHPMDAIDATDLVLAERVFRGRFADLQNPRIGRQLRGLFVAAGLVHVEVEVITEVKTSWAEFNALQGPKRLRPRHREG
jgi:ubiquinone/menaquinone biosynthesis C-methylase UbiE